MKRSQSPIKINVPALGSLLSVVFPNTLNPSHYYRSEHESSLRASREKKISRTCTGRNFTQELALKEGKVWRFRVSERE